MIRRIRESKGHIYYPREFWRTLGDSRLSFRQRLAIWLAIHGRRWDVRIAAGLAWVVFVVVVYAMCAEALR